MLPALVKSLNILQLIRIHISFEASRRLLFQSKRICGSYYDSVRDIPDDYYSAGPRNFDNRHVSKTKPSQPLMKTHFVLVVVGKATGETQNISSALKSRISVRFLRARSVRRNGAMITSHEMGKPINQSAEVAKSARI